MSTEVAATQIDRERVRELTERESKRLDEATPGSVIRNAERISPSISGRSHFFLCSLEP